MDWSRQQHVALARVQEWLTARDPDKPIFRLFGYAGTGKSTLAKYIGEMESERKPGYAQFCAFTGKAAVVMRRKGCENAKTLHSILYTSHDKGKHELERLTDALTKATPEETLKLQEAIAAETKSLQQPGFTPKPKESALTVWVEVEDEIEGPIRIPKYSITMFVVDECSMVDERIGKDLLALGKPILVLGDPAQLPPVGGGGYFTEAAPDILLTEIHRQAIGSPIIDMANQIRQGNTLNLGQFGGGCGVVTPNELGAADWLAADQILVGMNATRRAFNRRIRELKGLDEFLPMPGEKLVCLRNNHQEGLLNGGLWECIESTDLPTTTLFKLRARSLDGDREIETIAHKATFLGQVLDIYERNDANEFDFGYALTVHKSQGSQWDNVILMDEWKNRDSRKQWLYTGITRAAERITVVRP